MKRRINDGMRHHETSNSRTSILHRVITKTVNSDLISKQTPTAGHNPVTALTLIGEMSTFKERLEGRMDANCVANQVPRLSVYLLDVL